LLIAIAESELGMSVATYTHLGNANNLLCREAEKSVYKTCVSRTSSSKARLGLDYEKQQTCKLPSYKTVRWVKVVSNQ